MRRYLVVANQTLGGEHLLDTIRKCLAQGPCRFYLLVPATPTVDQVVATEDEADQVAQRRLEAGLDRLATEGVIAEGEIGDADPVRAVQEVLRHEEFDEIILSTLPPGASRWIKQDLPKRLARSTNLVVTHVAAEADRVPIKVGDEILIERTGSKARRGEVLEVRGAGAREHYVVQWDDGQVSIYFPGGVVNTASLTSEAQEPDA